VHSFKNRLLILIVALMVLTEGVTIVLALVYLNRGVRTQLAQQLTATRTMLDRMLEDRARQLRAATDVLVADFAFREAATSGDRATILSALGNHARRIDAEVATLYQNDGTIVASTLPASFANDAATLDDAEAAGAPGFVVISGRPYQMVFAPLRAPETIGWVALGFALDRQLAIQLRDLAGSDVSFIAHDRAGRDSYVISTLSEDNARAMLQPLPASAAVNRPTVMRLGATEYLMLSAPLYVRNGRIDLLVQRSLDVALAQFREMRLALLLIGGASLLGAIVVAWLAGRTAVRPLGALVAAAQRIRQGDYQQPISVAGSEEFLQLAASFNSMQSGIREREARILDQATHDSLTDLPNRYGLRQWLAARPLGDGPCTLALIDVHRFRDLNASVGHQVGDELLRVLSTRLRLVAGAQGCCARVGADQFIIVLPARAAEVHRALQTQTAELLQGVEVGELHISVELRAGLAEWRSAQVSIDDLLRQIDVALVQAKESGTQFVSYQASHDADHRRRVTLVAELRQAIARNELHLAFQPLVLMTSREAVSLEALVRWTHPTLGVISPAEFVPLAERASAVADLTRWVLAAAIAQLGLWRAQGLTIELAVNLSASDLSDEILPGRVLALLREHNVAAAQLMLEVTESAIMREPAQATRVMQQLRDAGVRFAIDDFGTGHSSLAQLHTLPVDELKIDRSFVINLERSANNQAIVRSTTELGHILGLRVVAEGVETPAVWTALLRLGCDLAQGYFISRPMPAAEVPGWMSLQRANLSRALADARQDGTVAPLRARGSDRPG
jgi:diguanylate cyclase (GGDEF)-like protein